MMLKIFLGWVLSGAVNTRKQQGSETCCLATTRACSRTGQVAQIGQNIYVSSHRASSTSLRKELQFGKAIRLFARGMFAALLEFSQTFGLPPDA